MEWDEEFAGFVRQHSDALFRSSWLLVADRYAAADLVQETLTRLYPKWHLVKAADSQLAYVRGALTKQYLSQARRRSSSELTMLALPELPAVPSGDPDDRVLLAGPIQALSPRQRTAIVLRYFEDRDDREAARAMGCPVATFRSHVRRGLAALRQSMTADDVVPSHPGDVRSA